MPQVPIDFGPDRWPFAVAAWWLPDDEAVSPDLASIRFPARTLSDLPDFRVREHVAVDLALRALGTDSPVLHSPDGAPCFRDDTRNLSISHSRHPSEGIIAVVMIASTRCGIDVEFPRRTLSRIAPRIFSPGELAAIGDSVDRACPVWCLKEAAWKAFGPELDFREDIVQLSPPALPGLITAQILGTPQQFVVGRLTPVPGGATWWVVAGTQTT
jgi:hypothetical protein